jgi:hypothetical protein
MDQELLRIAVAAGLTAFGTLLKYIFDKVQQFRATLLVTIYPNHFRLPGEIQDLLITYRTKGLLGVKPKDRDEKLIRFLGAAKNLHVIRVHNSGKEKCENIRIRRYDALFGLNIFDVVDSSSLDLRRATTHVADEVTIPTLQPGTSMFVLVWTFHDHVYLPDPRFSTFSSRSLRSQFEISSDNAARIKITVHLHEQGRIQRAVQSLIDRMSLTAFSYLANVLLVFMAFFAIYSAWPILLTLLKLFR